MPKNKKFRLRLKADKDLEDIYEYSYQRFGEQRADKYIEDLDAAFFNLAENTNLGIDCGDIRRGLRMHKVVSHMVFFRPSSYGAIIIRVLHKSMDYRLHGAHI